MDRQFDDALIGEDDTDGAVKVVDFEAGRRSFIRSLGIGALGATVIGTAGLEAAHAQAGPTEADVLNFALNLEYLEAEFYLRAATGSGLNDSQIGQNPGQVTGGRKVAFADPIIRSYAQEISQDEKLHVNILRASLGTAAVDRPAIDLQQSFTTAAQAAGLIGPNQTFDAFANDTNFLLAAYIFEDVGVTAYHGGAAFLTGNATYLDVAAGILATEAYHAGLVRTVLFVQGQTDATKAISDLRQSLGPVDSSTGKGGRDTGVRTQAQPNVVLADNAAVAFKRSPRAVLNVVYGKKGANKGLFFPAGLNGAIK